MPRKKVVVPVQTVSKTKRIAGMAAMLVVASASIGLILTWVVFQ